jgi:hypothetical protein
LSPRPLPLRFHICAVTAGLALLAWGLAARAELVDVQFDAAGRFAHQATVAPAKFVELCGKLAKGAKVRWQFEASGPLNFNVHYHVGKEVVYPEQRNAARSASGELHAKIEQDYCWMWSNKSEAATTVNVTLQR